MFPEDELLQDKHKYDVVMLMATDYLNQTVGVVAWISIFAVLHFGPNSGKFIDLGFNYSQGVMFSAIGWAVITVTFILTRWMKLRDRDTTSRKRKQRAGVAYRPKPKPGVILGTTDKSDPGYNPSTDPNNVAVLWTDVDIDLFNNLVFLCRDATSREVIFANIVTAVGYVRLVPGRCGMTRVRSALVALWSVTASMSLRNLRSAVRSDRAWMLLSQVLLHVAAEARGDGVALEPQSHSNHRCVVATAAATGPVLS